MLDKGSKIIKMLDENKGNRFISLEDSEGYSSIEAPTEEQTEEVVTKA